MKRAIICFNCGKMKRESESYQMKIKDYKNLSGNPDTTITISNNPTPEEMADLKKKIEKLPFMVKVKCCRKCTRAAGYFVSK